HREFFRRGDIAYRGFKEAEELEWDHLISGRPHRVSVRLRSVEADEPRDPEPSGSPSPHRLSLVTLTSCGQLLPGVGRALLIPSALAWASKKSDRAASRAFSGRSRWIRPTDFSQNFH